MALLDTLPVITLWVGKTEKTFLQKVTVQTLSPGPRAIIIVPDLLFFVPKREGNVEVAVSVGHPGDAVFTPTVRPRAGMIVRKVWTHL